MNKEIASLTTGPDLALLNKQLRIEERSNYFLRGKDGTK
jgi:hypothetical protein